ncbi:DUF58 domain-containing protein [Raineya orbicola]|jgi:uncharacterized protein (DUF58 family)|uniref:DUF58 domain-containing protein n=1 Tax=Raineya orbicola TaxID=2016530 RepID=A0A2N3IIM4_9BACT|nr:DUF58 domain-containing protein [Raineya orbicola]PKQ70164.1 hypothetical protein Rain11_0824 [Raineya orbicola]
MQEILSKLRKYEIQIRKAVNTYMQGDFHSIFKGSGLEFSDVRDYLYGDDVRRIDWNVSAKGQGIFVKEFQEEKEQTVFFVLDVSASQEIGFQKNKLNLAYEIAGVLALSAAKEKNDIGLICFSSQKERYMKPQKGEKYAYEMIFNLFKLKPQSTQTDLAQMIIYTLQMLKRKSVVILISDFIGENYEHHLKALAQKHDLVMLQLFDKQEIRLPAMGIIPVWDKESKRTIWVNTHSRDFKALQKPRFESIQQKLQEIALKNNANYLAISTQEDFVPKLLELFKKRKHKLKKNYAKTF